MEVWSAGCTSELVGASWCTSGRILQLLSSYGQDSSGAMVDERQQEGQACHELLKKWVFETQPDVCSS